MTNSHRALQMTESSSPAPLDAFQIETMRSVLREHWRTAGHSHEMPDKLCDMALAMLQPEVVAQQWVPVEKGKPPNDSDVLIAMHEYPQKPEQP